MRRIITSLAAAALALALISLITAATPQNKEAQSGTTRICYIDFAVVIEKSRFTQEFKKKVSADLFSKVEPLMAKRKNLEEIQAKLAKQEGILSQKELEELVNLKVSLLADMEKDQYNIGAYRKSADREMSETYQQIVDAAGAVAQAQNYDMVLRKENLIYGSPATDISEKVAATLDKVMNSKAGAATKSKPKESK